MNWERTISRSGCEKMTDDWGTPDWLMSVFETWFDPCPLDPLWKKSGLELEWGKFHDQIFVNPPYSDPRPWVEKAISEHLEHGSTVVLLLKHDSSTQWYRRLHEEGARFLLIEGRLKFKGRGTKPCAFPSVLAVLS